jgi:hypothetical protein
MNFDLIKKATAGTTREEIEKILLEGGYAPDIAWDIARIMWRGRLKRQAQTTAGDVIERGENGPSKTK